ncbi:PIG-L family deacetylase [Caldichromatium japonicum]|uniref:PIG-L family deacetylase n=1 Tax=Caldichromatium japonicum TaxID=2699430 RepID=A0A6G7VF52_9GAMM|nr:PIG-L deacetylase family protein [Caldichromatium japonicum]QIK38614.1 PIG-L family deacetylase [Caldichromatium japonicum]
MSILEHQFIPYRVEYRLGRGRVLVFAPHPDDEVLGCGGAIMRHVAGQDPVRVILCTDGALGLPPDHPPPIETRRQESRAAAQVLGYGEPIFWDWPDRGLIYGEPLIAQIQEAIADWPADLVYAPSCWEVHPDHLNLALACAEAIRRCERPIQLVFYEVGVPLWPNLLLDITDLSARKKQALECFASQMLQQDYSRQIAGLNAFRSYTLGPEVKAAEGYRVLSREALNAPPWDRLRLDSEEGLKDLAESLRLPCPPAEGAASSVPQLALRLEVQRLERELAAIRGSTSWRLTAPLRWLKRALSNRSRMGR